VRYGEKSALPAALTGGAALAAIAAAIGPGATLEVDPSFHQRAILWVPLLAPRGAGKSPAQDLAFSPLRRHDEQLADDEDGEVLLGDTTLEALARDLHASDGAAALDLDELAVLLRGMGEYKGAGGGDRGRFLGLWTGGPWNYRRVGSSGKSTNAIKLRIPRPTLVICGGLQPALHELLGGEEDGLRPRWSPHLAEMPDDPGSLNDAPVPIEWQLLLGGQLLPIRGNQRLWKLDAEARTVFNAYRRTWKLQARGHESASISAALQKADIPLARFVLVLAEADRPGEGGDVSAGLVHRAARIVDFTLDCWRALPEQGALALSRRDETLDRGITRLIAWLEEHGGKATRRELQRARVAGVRTPTDLDQLLKRYEDTYPGTVTEARGAYGRGLPTVIVSAPARRASTPVSPPGDTTESAPKSPREHWGSEDVTTGDTNIGDTQSGDTTPEAESEEQSLDDQIEAAKRRKAARGA
jgi:hypothetical protein